MLLQWRAMTSERVLIPGDRIERHFEPINVINYIWQLIFRAINFQKFQIRANNFRTTNYVKFVICISVSATVLREQSNTMNEAVCELSI